VLGTAHYLSPEQAKGERKIDGRADIYSLGATLYSLITGATPFKGATQALVMMMHIRSRSESERPRAGPAGRRQSADHENDAKTPEERFANCDEVIGEMERILATLPKAPPATKRGSVITALPNDETQTAVKRRCRFRPSRRLRPCLRRKSLRRSAHRRKARRSKRLPCRLRLHPRRQFTPRRPPSRARPALKRAGHPRVFSSRRRRCWWC